jgi:hypothetical protein
MRRNKLKEELAGKRRLQSEIVEAVHGLHKIGALSDRQLEKTTVKMVGQNALTRRRVQRRKRSEQDEPERHWP